MAKKTGAVSGLAARLGAEGRKAFEEHKNDTAVIPGGGELPAGIENGVARLVMCKFGTYESGDLAGEPYFMASAVVVEPSKLGKIPLTGLRTNIGPEPLCDTPTRTRATLDAHVAWVINQIKLILGDDAADTEINLDTVEAIAAALEEAKPYIRFRTYVIEKRKVGDPKYNEQYDGPDSEPARVIQSWLGSVSYEESDEDETGVEDNTAEPEPKKTVTKPSEKPTATPPVKGKKEAVTPTKAAPVKGVKAVKGKPAPVEDIPFGDDLDMTADKADNGDVDAMEYLKTEALKLNYPEENIDNTNNWGEVADMIRSGEFVEEVSDAIDWDQLGSDADGGDQEAIDRLTELGNEISIDVNDHSEKSWAEFAALLSESSASPEEEEEEWKPAVKEVYKTIYMKGKPAVECEITAVDETKKTVSVKNLNDKKAYKNISWTSLQQD